ncbi:MAG: folate family ECF transporter S component [Clostridiales bacterium]|jgi:ECF transporter S component (folate family)|nr:folate family ECF transporter S component [Clostridiales bacterium]
MKGNANIFSARGITAMSVLIAIQVVFARFLSFSQWNMRIGFAFVPLIIAAVMLGPTRAAFVGGISDFVGAMLFPSGAFFPGFTLTAALMGLVFGLFLYKRQTMARIIASVAVNQLILSLLLNTLWISILYGSPFHQLVEPRAIQCAVTIPVQIATIGVVTKTIGVYLKYHAQQYS